MPTGFCLAKLHVKNRASTVFAVMPLTESIRPALLLCRSPLVAAGTAMLVVGCGATPEPQIGYTQPQLSDQLGQGQYQTDLEGDYVLRPSDKIAISVLREPDLSFAEIMIAADGTVSLPLTGSVLAASQTAKELEISLQSKLRTAGLKRPMVSVNIVSYGSHVVTVEGGVQEPGVYPFQPGARLSSAIALANGPNRVSKLSEVVVFRPTDEGMSVALFDYQAVRQGVAADPIIEPGDRVVVGISGLSQFWQDLIRALPAFGLFTNINR